MGAEARACKFYEIHCIQEHLFHCNICELFYVTGEPDAKLHECLCKSMLKSYMLFLHLNLMDIFTLNT